MKLVRAGAPAVILILCPAGLGPPDPLFHPEFPVPTGLAMGPGQAIPDSWY